MSGNSGIDQSHPGTAILPNGVSIRARKSCVQVAQNIYAKEQYGQIIPLSRKQPDSTLPFRTGTCQPSQSKPLISYQLTNCCCPVKSFRSILRIPASPVDSILTEIEEASAIPNAAN